MSALEHDYTEVAEGVIVRDMLTITHAIDLWLGDLARRGRSHRTRDSYRRTLDKFADQFPTSWDVAKVTGDDCGRFLDQWRHTTVGTQNAVYSPLKGLFKWLCETRRLKDNPMEFVFPPTRKRPDELDVVTVSTDEVKRMLAKAMPGREKNAIAILAYLGPRRSAVNALRLRDYDRERGMMRFKEKGGKTIWKPVPARLAEVLDASIRRGEIREPDDYLVPGKGNQRREGDRDSRLIHTLVTDVADRAGVKAHVHALRAAFAVFYLEQKPGDSYGLQHLMGHVDPATTQIYLRRLDKAAVMESVRDLDWGDNTPKPELPQTAENYLGVKAVAEKEGFEPSLDTNPLHDKASSQHSDDELVEALKQAALARFREPAGSGGTP